MPRLFLHAALSASLIIALLAFPSLGGTPAPENQRDIFSDQVRLQRTLLSVAGYCEKVKRIALFYVCVEKMDDKEYFFRDRTFSDIEALEERSFTVRRVVHRTATYDYQLIKKGEDIQEDRTLLEENGKKRNVKHAARILTKYSPRLMIFGPVGFLSAYWQQHFKYSVIGEDRVGDFQALVIRAVPTEKREDNCQAGRIWVGPDAQVLRIEIEPASLGEYKDEVIADPWGISIRR